MPSARLLPWPPPSCDETISTIPTKPHTSPSAPTQGIRSPRNRRANTSTNSGEVLARLTRCPHPHG